ncbi:MAG TPA: hypothetical protein VM733_09010 [Thermoanaerobaculia bacterium]|nr:hypothetical protein [Thermoanaerobaculia bacterium]
MAVRAVRNPDDGRIDFFDERGRVVSTVTVERDAYGRTTEIVQTTGATVTARLRHRYFDDELRIHTTVTIFGIDVSQRDRTFDERGVVIAERETQMNGTARDTKHSYTFNEIGDWIEVRSVIRADDVQTESVTRRTIAYV